MPKNTIKFSINRNSTWVNGVYFLEILDEKKIERELKKIVLQ
jgi:hypothetical protein